MRPRGEIRQVLAQVVDELAAARAQAGMPGCTWRDAAAHARVGFRAARDTLQNMAAAGEVAKVGQLPVPGSRRPMTLYAPARAPWVTQTTGNFDLQAVWR